MPRKAGANIRGLALDRKFKATRSFALAAGCVLGPSFLSLQKVPIPVPFYLVGLAAGGLFVYQGRELLALAARADQGAKGEEEIGKILKQLPSGWRTEYNRPVSGVGDVDVIVHSPQGKTWVVDVKSHGGYIYASKGQLKRKLGKNSVPLEKDFITAAKKQAVLVKDADNLQWVTPVICFSSATVQVKQPVNGVHVVQKSELLEFLMTH
jgi:Nuclease-related domain